MRVISSSAATKLLKSRSRNPTWIIFTSILLVVLALAAPTACAQATDQGDRGTIPGMVQEAKKSNVTHLAYPHALVLYADFKSPEEAIDKSSVLIARLTDRSTTHTDLQLITWNKFQLVEVLHWQPKSYNERMPDDIPSSLLPLRPDEFLVPTSTGSEVIDGVTVSISDPLQKELTKSSTYILFVTRRSPQIATLIFGPPGMFSVDEGGLLKPIMDIKYNKLGYDLSMRQKDHIDLLRTLTSTRK